MSAPLGRIGIWRLAPQLDAEFAAEAERLGYGTIWVGGSPPADPEIVERLLDATRGITVATGIVNIWNSPAQAVAESFHRVDAKHPGRFVLGVGAGHREANTDYRKPYQALVDHLDVLDAAEVPQSQRVLAALGPKVLRLARDRAAGAHPYLTTPDHTRAAREVLGDALLAPEQKVVVDTDVERARATGRAMVTRYLNLVNYVRNLQRHGFSPDELTPPGSDRVVDALALHGTAEQIAEGVDAHLRADADHVSVQVLGDDPLAGYRALAEALELR